LKKLTIEEELPEGFVVLANNQTQGRGIGKNTWESEAGKNLTFSLLLRPVFLKAEEMFMVSKAISLGIVDYLNSLDKCFTIKWPNDIYYCNKKMGGILIENQLLGNKLNYSLIGIGINLNQEIFHGTAPNPVALKTILKKDINKTECLNGILKQITIWYEILSDGWFEKINQTYFTHLYRNIGYHNFSAHGETFLAKIKSVENDGKLVLKTQQADQKEFYFKEVEFIFN
jgi:BirA family biotin operon repressor/biotin-[acetyl-CoA-carboxylase] ligase